MEKLTVQELAPYLPYGLKVLLTESNKTAEMLVLNKILFRHQIQIQTIYGTYGDMYFKPILRPISDLTKEIEYNGEKFVPQSKLSHLDLEWLITSENLIMKTNYEDVLQLLEWHFDVFGLIEKGLAIDINTVNAIKTSN